MAQVVLKHTADADILTPPAGKKSLAVNADGDLVTKDSDGNIFAGNSGYYKITAAHNIESNRFVNFAGAYPSIEAKSFGVSTSFIAEGEEGYIQTYGVCQVEAGTLMSTSNPGDRVAADVNGLCKKGTSAMQVNGRNISGSALEGELVTILLVT